MANDKRDDRIAELEKGLGRMREENAALKEQLSGVEALKGEIEKKTALVSDREKTIEGLRAELQQARAVLSQTDQKTVQGLDAKCSAQLATSVTMQSTDNTRVDAKSGDVVVCGEKDAIDALRKRLGVSVKAHHITRATFDELVAKGMVRA
jgi:type II secretory pathway component PulM